MSNVYSAYQHQSSAFQPEKLGQYRLRLVLRPGLLTYAVLSETGQILAVKEFRSKSPMDFPAFFDAIYAQDYFLKEEYKAVEIVDSSLEFSLIPTAFFKPQQVREFAGALIREDVDVDHLAFIDMAASGTTAIYTVPFHVKQKCDSSFQSPDYHPLCELLITMAEDLSRQHPQLLLVHVFERQFVVTAMKDGRLQLCNAYTYESAADMVYFTQLVMEILKMETDRTRILISGEFEEDSELLRQLRKYIPTGEVPKRESADRFETKGDKLPAWKYAYMSW